MNDMTLYRSSGGFGDVVGTLTVVSQIASGVQAAGDAPSILAGAWSRISRGAGTAIDQRAASAAGAAMDELMRREPAAAARITAQVNAAVAQSLTAATAAAQTIVQNTLRQAAVALIQAQPYLAQQVEQLGARGGAAATRGAADTLQSKIIPLTIGALVVGVAAYGIARSMRRSK